MNEAVNLYGSRPDDGHEEEVYYGEDGGSLFTLNNIRALLWRQRYILVGVTALALIAGLLLTLLMKPYYQATSQVRVDYNENDIVEGQDLTSTYLTGTEVARYLETQAAEIRSRSMALQVVDDLDLASGDRLLGPASDDAGTALSEDATLEARRDLAASILVDNLTVEVPMESRVISIRYSAAEPVLSADVANAYARAFLSNDLGRSLEAYSYAREYLQEQIDETRNALREAEILANQYARQNAIVGQPFTSVRGDGGESETVATPTLTASNLAQINRRYVETRAARIAAQERWESVANTSAMELPEVQGSAVAQQLRGRIAELEARLADLLERYQEEYPEVREVRAEIVSLERQLARVAAEIKNSIRSEYLIARNQEQALQSELERVSGEALDEQDRRVQYNLLDRDVAAYRSQLASLLERFNEISSAANLQSSKVTLLDEATVPRSHYKPNLMRNMLIALVVGGGLALGLAFLREIFDDRLRSTSDLERRLGVPALGQTPFTPEGEITEALEDPFSAISESYSSVRATLDFALPPEARQVIQFTSGQQMEGKTTSALAVAARYAAVGKKVLLMDVDLRRPAVAKRLTDQKPKDGLVSALYGRADYKSLLLKTDTANLDVLPAGKAPPNPVEILSSGLMHDFLAQVRDEYDVVIIDGPPVMGLADAPLVSRFVDCTVFVAEANRVEFGKTRAAVRRLRDAGANIAGAILTKYRALEAGESYNYEYQYYTYSKG
ncbi:GumC family protein [Aurantiacibacter sp. MUD61]|uniref:GumC family protein n=1 Tax=Aurantiacibacter sp. MUD61 TaxID=3009083 RepID=UPI0022F0EE04|nr:polysaccharide biosynthesis tyrosine autokinase [Aurantiacibacter sp. MUD61]